MHTFLNLMYAANYMLSDKEIKQLQDVMHTCKHPIYFFHDDPDGLCSFLLLYRAVKEGKGYCLKAYPQITKEFAEQVDKYGADAVFILDIAKVDQDFLDAVNVPVYWIDHHTILDRQKVHYFNPRKKGKNIPVSILCWQIVKDERPDDIWISVMGAISDWHLPENLEDFRKKYPKLLPKKIKKIGDALFNSPLAPLAKVFSFNLKGSTKGVNQSIKVFTRIENPDEILEQKTSAGKFLWKKYEKINNTYKDMFDRIFKTAKRDRLFVYTYSHDNLSLTKDLSNDLLYKLKNKVIVLGRIKSGEVRCSLRAPAGIRLDKALEKALVGIEGYGGGHEQACGAGIKQEDFDRFIENLRRSLEF